ncbi:MAG: DUF4982 domain-containing protein [Ruminococcus sp.]|nr:DUF4982 domain-containing protein [Ruminococcus sp.]
MGIKRLFCDHWEFAKTALGTAYSDDLNWSRVDLPHDWLIYDTRQLYETSTGWYRKKFICSKDEAHRTEICFDGVYMDSRMYVNGVCAGEWKYGYSSFAFDITDLLHDGENLITVRVDHQSPNSRWYSGAGIYRNVYLCEYPLCHLLRDGVYLSAKGDGTLIISTETARPADQTVETMKLRHIVRLDGAEIARTESRCCAADASQIPQEVRTDSFRYTCNTDTILVTDPVLWDIDTPRLYTLETQLICGDRVIDTAEQTFGFKNAVFTADHGFFLNGRHLKLHGCCEHHDLGALGAAMNRAALARKLTKLREMGINAIRTSHNMPARELMELCDEMGFLVLSEGFDMWELSKTEFDYARYFKEWVARDVAAWVRRDRNHACLIGWSVGNEIYDTHASDRGQEIISLLKGLVRLHDDRANGVVTIGSNYMQWDGAQRCADIVKVAGYNYAEPLYHAHHAEHPDWMIYGSETSSVVQSRGIYHFPRSLAILCDDDEQCSALGNSSPAWAAKCTEACILPDRDAEFCAGQFIWTGFDYIGEPTPYSTKNSYFGQYDTAGFAKDSAYLFRGAWTDHKTAPFVHIYPYWDFSEGERIDIRVATNAPKVILFFNGEQIAEKEIDQLHGQELTLDTQLPYSVGELLAIAYDETGREIARDMQRSFGDTARLSLSPDKTELQGNGTDMIFVEISAEDENGTFVANANNRVFVSVSGAGRLVGLDNGDSTDYDQYKGRSRRLFSGRLLAMIAARTEGGEIYVTASSPGLPDTVLKLHAVSCPVPDGVSALTENTDTAAECGDGYNDIPVRKITLAEEHRVFTKACDTLTFTAVAHPSNATYAKEIEFRLTDVHGIDTNLAEIVHTQQGVITVTCKGDGEFYLRALCKNGTEKYHILATFAMRGEGLGSASFDPYEMVMGGLHTISRGDAGTGIERGAAFASDDCWIGFENVDFGPIGSDTVEIPIYANCTTPVSLSIYDGIPDEGGELIGEFVYHKPPVWLTYQSERFTLTKKLKGVHTIVLKSKDRYEFKGFVFDRPEKEFARLNATTHETIYGDKFTCEADAVTGIGNNVIIGFGAFDFTDKQPGHIMVCGKSALPVNSLHLIVTGETEERVLIEFTGADAYTERRFPLPAIRGRCEISFLFLPGCDFDFHSFRFEE